MRKLIILLFGLFVALRSIGGAIAAPVYTYDVVGGTWSDVNKANVFGAPDSLLCWAASASNILSWTSWWGWNSGTSTYISSAGDIYQVFGASWSNTVGAPTYAYEWWMTNRTESIIQDPPGSGISAKVFPSAGKNFYPGVDVQTGASVTAFVTADVNNDNVPDNNVKNWIDTYVNDHRGIAVTIDVPVAGGGASYTHSLTVWGIDFAANQIFVTDSDDGATELDTYGIFQDANGFWNIDNYSNLYTTPRDVRIDQVVRLNRNDPFIEPARNGIPEPGSLALIALGAVGLALVRRRQS